MQPLIGSDVSVSCNRLTSIAKEASGFITGFMVVIGSITDKIINITVIRPISASAYKQTS